MPWLEGIITNSLKSDITFAALLTPQGKIIADFFVSKDKETLLIDTFVGQEVVSRMKRMTTVKKRMRGVIFNGAATAGDRIMAGERVIGDILSVHGQLGMALIRLDRLSDAATQPTVNDVAIKIMDSVDGQSH